MTAGRFCFAPFFLRQAELTLRRKKRMIEERQNESSGAPGAAGGGDGLSSAIYRPDVAGADAGAFPRHGQGIRKASLALKALPTALAAAFAAAGYFSAEVRDLYA